MAFFNGKEYTSPNLAIAVNDDGMQDQNISASNNVGIIGRSAGGKPQSELVFSNPWHAREVLRSGELLDAIICAFSPSGETPGPNKVYAYRVNPATQASLTLLDASAGDSITLQSRDYGIYTNRITVKVESGTNEGKKITTSLDSGVIVRDDIARDAFTCVYTGAEATATITITPTSVVLAAPAGTTVATIDLNAYPTVIDLTDKISTYAGFLATPTIGSETTAALNGLDGVTAQSVKTTPYQATAILQACIDYINSLSNPYLIATRPATAAKVPANISTTYLTGGSDGTVTNNDWQTCFDVSAESDIQWIVPLSSSSTIWQMADAHCVAQEALGGIERTAIVGGASGTSVSQAITEAASLSSPCTAYCYPGVYVGGVLRAPYITAAYIAGILAGSSPGSTATNKQVRVEGIERLIRKPSDTDSLQLGGVLTLYKTHSGTIVVNRANSTWTKDRKFNLVELSVRAAVLFVKRAVKEALTPFIGKKANPITMGLAKSTVESVLNQLATPEPAGLGILAGDVKDPAYKDIRVEIAGDVLRVSFTCQPVLAINYVFVTMTLQQYNGSI